MPSMRTRLLPAFLLCLATVTSPLQAADPGTITIHADQPGPKIGPLFYGLMTEEINHAYDGGLYAELIQNRIFQDNNEPRHWSAVQSKAGATIAIDETNPVNTVALKRSLRLDIADVQEGGRAGIANDGYWGIPVHPNTKYRARFYARAAEGFNGPLTVSIESNDGATTFATGTVTGVGADWKKYDVELNTGDVAVSTGNRFVISTNTKGTIWFSLVSLFPPTYKDRPNGNRIDLMEKMAELHPSFLRFPGGNFLEGPRIVDWYNWKTTIGSLEDRPGHGGSWGYRSSDGLGLTEFLYWCEDLKMEPILAVYAGYSLRGEHVNPGKDLEYYVQEALDEIEYVTGDASTTWGARRAKDGHPEPFKLQFVEIGNEDWFDRSGSYDARFTQFFDAIKAKYPNLQCIATAAVKTRRPDLYDDHDYPSPRAMLKAVHRYDKPDPERPKVFFGEWATQDGKPTPTHRAALADAAWLIGLQHNADTVLMNCYAPLLVNVNPGGAQWGTNLIGYDAARSFGSPSFQAQAMFSRSWGDTVLTSEVVPQKVELPPAPASTGAIGVGTWATSAEFKDIKVSDGDKTLFEANFTEAQEAPNRVKGWRGGRGGNWETKDGVLTQTDPAEDIRLTAGDAKWQDYTLTLKARAVSGNEGFLVLFHVRDRNNYRWLNVGGWGNSRSALEQMEDGNKAEFGTAEPFTVEQGKWYDVKIVVKDREVKAYIDDKLIAQGTDEPAQPAETIFASATGESATGDIILKVVNVVGAAQQLEINLPGVTTIGSTATVETLAGQPGDQNTVETPEKTSVKKSEITGAGTKFTHEFPAYSASVIRLKTKG